MNGRNNGRTAAIVALALTLAIIGQLLGFIKLPSAMAAIETGVTVNISSKASGNHSFTAAGNSTSANDILVLPGEQVTINSSFATTAVSDRVHYREDGSALNADQVNGAAPIVWGWNPSSTAYVLGVFPQDNAGNDLSSPIFIKVYAINPQLAASPNVVAANGPAVSIMPSWTPSATTKFVFNPGYGADLGATTNAGATVTYTIPGDYTPTVKFLNAANEVIATATANTVYVNTNVTITPANSTKQEGTQVTFAVPELQSFWSMTVPPSNLSVIWTLPDGTEYDTALATRNGDQARADQVNWWVSKSGVVGVSVQINGIEVGTATTSITMNPNSEPQPVKVPSLTVTPDPVWTASITGTLSLFVTNPPTNTNNLAIRITAPGYGEYNAWLGTPRQTLPDGRVKLDVLYNFPTAGNKAFSIAMDYVDEHGVWKSLPVQTVNVTVNAQPSGEIVGKTKFYVSEAMSFTLVLHDLQLMPGDNVLWTGPWGEYNTGSQSNPLTFAKFQTTPWKGNVVVRVQRGNTNLLTVFKNDVTAGQMYQVSLPLVVNPPTQVNISSSTPAPTMGQEFILTANYATGNEAQFIWDFGDGRGEYNSTDGFSKGQQPAPNKVKFTPAERRHYKVTLIVRTVVNGQFQTTAAGTFDFDAR